MVGYGKYIFLKEKVLPIYITYFVTSRCNLKCQHCFYWESLNAIRDELSLEEVEKFSKTIGKPLVLSLTGGEPFLRKDLGKIVKIFYKNSKPKIVSIVTNGYFTKNCLKVVKDILFSCKFISLIVELSIDGLEGEHNSIRLSNNSFKKALSTFKALKKLKLKYRNFNIGVITTFSSINQYKMKEIMLFIKKNLNPDSFTISLIRGDSKNKVIKNINIEQYRKVVTLKNKIFKSSYNNFSLSSLKAANDSLIEDIVYKVLKYRKFQTPCYASSLSSVISPNGDVLGCEILNNKIGNMRDFDYDFRKLWFTKERADISSNIIKNKCFCTHECNISVNTMFNVRHYPKLALKLAEGVMK